MAFGCVPSREQSGCILDSDLLYQYAFLAVAQVRLALARRSDETCGRFLKPHCIIDTGKVDRVLHAAHHHRLLVVRSVSRAPLSQKNTLSIAPSVMRMKDNLCAAHRRPSHRLGIAPAFVANRNSKRNAVDLEESAGISGHIELIFGRVELVLGLVTLNFALSVNDKGYNLAPQVRDPFDAEDRGDLI